MQLNQELELFNKSLIHYNNSDNALVSVLSLQVAQQLKDHVHAALDWGWILRCILDINSDYIFSSARFDEDLNAIMKDREVEAEFKHAKLLIKITRMMLAISLSEFEIINESELVELNDDSKAYYGCKLSLLHDQLVNTIMDTSTGFKEEVLA